MAAKIEDTLTWLNEKITAQEDAGLLSEPVLLSSDMNAKLTKVQKLFKKVTDKKKPKEKKEKKVESEESDKSQEEHASTDGESETFDL